MLTKLIKVGNSKGIRIPATILKECQIDNQIELEVKGNTIIIRSAKKVRSGWDKAFKTMNKNGDDKLIMEQIIDTEMDDWEW